MYPISSNNDRDFEGNVNCNIWFILCTIDHFIKTELAKFVHYKSIYSRVVTFYISFQYTKLLRYLPIFFFFIQSFYKILNFKPLIE